ncbi:hypothetical protein BpHYR1_042846 [Brachionus plicatilis]|uniref:Uncharacterized protein n=1 Tax=Brachionus plicatilis TaxID=10195 RepID=A0A3M7PKN8_BRAPC|nr:hypothetical protein BpHYR1_042846 [Brachionus plicatilis]
MYDIKEIACLIIHDRIKIELTQNSNLDTKGKYSQNGDQQKQKLLSRKAFCTQIGLIARKNLIEKLVAHILLNSIS